MIGQKNLIEKLKTFSSNTLPHSMILMGEVGSEEECICEFISSNFNLSQFDLTECLSKEMLDEIYMSHSATLYTIDISKLDENKQNVLLKFYEEPNDYAYILLLCETDNSIIDTIKTRSYIFKKDIYTLDQLKTLTSNEYALKCCKTPGQIEIANHTDMDSLYKLCNDIIDVMKIASYQNALTIANKINYKDNYDKYDLSMFIKMMRYVSFIRCEYDIYNEIIKLCLNLNTILNKQLRVESFITNLWKMSRKV